MATQFRDTFTGTAGVSIALRSPETGAWTDGGFPINLDGTGFAVPVGFNNFAWSTTDFSLEGTLLCELRSDTAAGTMRQWFHANAGLTAGYAISLLSGTSGIVLEKDGASVATHSTGYTASALNAFVVCVTSEMAGVQRRVRIWANGNTGTPNINYLDTLTPPAGRRVGLEMVGGAAAQRSSLADWNDTVSVPIPPAPPPPTARPYRSAYVRKPRVNRWTTKSPAATVIANAFWGVPVVITSPVYIGAAGQATVYVGTGLASAKYLGTRTLF